MSTSNASTLKGAGVLLALATIAVPLVLAHHPMGHGADAAGFILSLQHAAGLDRLVHGALALLFCLIGAAMFRFAIALGIRRLPVLAGIIGFALALALLVLATMIDGFIAPAIALGCGATPAQQCVDTAIASLRLGGLAIEYLSRFASVGMALATLAWAMALLRSPAPRWAGYAGLATGLLQLGAIGAATEHLTPPTLLTIVAAQALWYGIAAVLMITGRAPDQTQEQV